MDLHTVESFRVASGRDDLRLSAGETWLAGGTWLYSEPQLDTTGLVDLTELAWPDWTLTDEGLSIAATCTITDLVAHAESSGLPGLAVARPCAEALVMSTKIWRLATAGGNVCLALPAGGITSLLAGLGAEAVVWNPAGGDRREAVATLVTGVRATTLAPGELVRSFEVPRSSLEAVTAFRRAALTPMGRSGSVIVGRRGADDHVVLTVTAAVARPWVLDLGVAPDEAAVNTAVGSIDPWYDDPHGAPDWRAAQTLRCALELVDELA